MNFPVEMRKNCVTWLIKTKSLPKLQGTEFIRKFGKLENSNKLIFMQVLVYKSEQVDDKTNPRTRGGP